MGEDGLYCLQCGCRPTIAPVQPTEKHCAVTQSFESIFLEEYLREIEEATEKAKQALREKKGFRRMLEELWYKEGLADKLTSRHLTLVECYSLLDYDAVGKLENGKAFSFLDRYSFATALNESHGKVGGHPFSRNTTDLALKLVLCASYQWLRSQEVERKILLYPLEKRKEARSAAYASIKNAFLLSNKILFRLGLDLQYIHEALSRALWEDKYKPIIIFGERIQGKRLIVGVTY